MQHYIISGDALKVIPEIPIQFDAVIVDPPYNTANKNTKVLKGRKARSSDFGTWDYFSQGAYLDFTDQWVRLVGEKLKESGNLILFSKLEHVGDLRKIYEKNGFRHHATIIWHKTNPAPQIRKNGFLSSCEAILWATRGFDDKKISYTFNFTQQNKMHNFIESPICMGNERTKHPTQKPEKVIKHLVETFTQRGEWILDCFAGSGTLAVVADGLKRNTISIESDKVYFQIMLDRIKQRKENNSRVSALYRKGQLAAISRKRDSSLRSI